VRDRDGWNFPNLLTVLLDRTIRTELATAGNTMYCHLVPFGLVTIGSVNTFLSCHVVIKIVTDQVLVVAIRQVVD